MQLGGYTGNLGGCAPAVEAALADLEAREIVARIWAKDHTVWSPDPTEISDRLGWLHAPERMRKRLPDLQSLADEIRQAGYRHIVLAGMGGSSVGSEVLRRLFGPGEGHPQLLVLDSTCPEWIDSVVRQIDVAETLFAISSKSGSTLETACFYKFFRQLADNSGVPTPQKNFIAITSPETSLDALARDDEFRRVIHNPPDVGSRYSGLSPLGLAPSVMAGMDVSGIIEFAGEMAAQCRRETGLAENPGVWLGATMAVMAKHGRDKLTLSISPSLEPFALWVEQMLAESTGKDGKGIVPIRGEPTLGADEYGDDRFFVFIQAADDRDSHVVETMKQAEAGGHPWVRIIVEDLDQIGAEFFRWQFATAVAGVVLGVHPFDQPNVQLAKDMTDQALLEYAEAGRLPERKRTGSVQELLAHARPGGYVAVMAYANQTPEMDDALATLRRRITRRYGVPVTLGYGPRILHSTGQMHKGGPDEGLFIQVTCSGDADFGVPGEGYSFRTLLEAQSVADIRALRAIGRRMAHVHLQDAGADSLRMLARAPI